jgi:hypothetical protein
MIITDVGLDEYWFAAAVFKISLLNNNLVEM